MGGYAAFVWPAYGVAAAVTIGLLVASLSATRARERELAALEARGVGRRPRRGTAGPEPGGREAGGTPADTP